MKRARSVVLSCLFMLAAVGARAQNIGGGGVGYAWPMLMLNNPLPIAFNFSLFAGLPESGQGQAVPLRVDQKRSSWVMQDGTLKVYSMDDGVFCKGTCSYTGQIISGTWQEIPTDPYGVCHIVTGQFTGTFHWVDKTIRKELGGAPYTARATFSAHSCSQDTKSKDGVAGWAGGGAVTVNLPTYFPFKP